MRKHMCWVWPGLFGGALGLFGHTLGTVEYWVLLMIFILYPDVYLYSVSEQDTRP